MIETVSLPVWKLEPDLPGRKPLRSTRSSPISEARLPAIPISPTGLRSSGIRSIGCATGGSAGRAPAPHSSSSWQIPSDHSTGKSNAPAGSSIVPGSSSLAGARRLARRFDGGKIAPTEGTTASSRTWLDLRVVMRLPIRPAPPDGPILPCRRAVGGSMLGPGTPATPTPSGTGTSRFRRIPSSCPAGPAGVDRAIRRWQWQCSQGPSL